MRALRRVIEQARHGLNLARIDVAEFVKAPGAGFEIVETRILADIITPADETWQWPRAFMETGARRLRELGYIDAGEVEAMARLLDEPPEGAHMLTPLVAEVIARKR